MNSNRINNVQDPASAQDAMTLNYFNNTTLFPNGIVNVTGTAQTIVPGTIYYANNSSQVVFTLPATFTTAQNQCFGIIGRGSGGWKIICNTGQQMTIGERSCTVSTGYFQSNQQNNSIIFYPSAANTSYQALAVIGNISNDLSQIANAIDVTFTANQLLYSPSAGNLSGLTTVASAQLVTNATGVPAMTSSMTNGQIVIGSTGGTPGPATITAGTNITVTNGANSVTIACSGSAASAAPSPNAIIGGNFDTNPWQLGVTFNSTANNTITADGFKWFQVGTGVLNITKTADAPATTTNIPYNVLNSLGTTVTTADTSITATKIYRITYGVEGNTWARLYGGAMTLSFWVKATVTGTYCISIANNGGSRIYIAEYSIPVAGTWTNIVINIPADNTGSWNLGTGQLGALITFTLAGGSNFQGSTGWNTTGGYQYCTSNQVNAMGTNSNTFRLALVYLQPGTVSSPVYPIEDPQHVLTRAQRFYETSVDFIGGNYFPTSNSNGGVSVNGPSFSGAWIVYIPFKVVKAVDPTVSVCDQTPTVGDVYVGTNGKTASTSSIGMSGFNAGGTATSASGLYFQWQANSYLF
ncbi:MAG TPA: hypothetical protein VGW78_07730 [Candidatus Babeliales bacterium]|nr:hypothetical protein [Candidatus Babeliales bacterium]